MSLITPDWQIAAAAGYDKMAVISGIGARAYYRKLGYKLAPGGGEYMIKPIELAHQVERASVSSTCTGTLISTNRALGSPVFLFSNRSMLALMLPLQLVPP